MIIIHKDKDKLFAQVEEALKANLTTYNEHSTIGEVQIVFESEDMRKRGVWSKQMSLGEVATREVTNQIVDWLKRNVIVKAGDLKILKRLDHATQVCSL